MYTKSTVILGNVYGEQRQKEDFYATDPTALERLLKVEQFSSVWEVASGQGHLVMVLKEHGIFSRKSDIVDRTGDTPVLDFLNDCNTKWGGDIITNPPFKYAQEFAEHALDLLESGRKLALLLRIQFLESRARQKLFSKHPLQTVWISPSRINCAKDGDFVKYAKASPAMYAWFVWEKDWKGETQIKFLPELF